MALVNKTSHLACLCALEEVHTAVISIAVTSFLKIHKNIGFDCFPDQEKFTIGLGCDIGWL